MANIKPELLKSKLHLRGQAIDVARRAGVSHARLATVLREAGYHLIELPAGGAGGRYRQAGRGADSGYGASPCASWTWPSA